MSKKNKKNPSDEFNCQYPECNMKMTEADRVQHLMQDHGLKPDVYTRFFVCTNFVCDHCFQAYPTSDSIENHTRSNICKQGDRFKFVSRLPSPAFQACTALRQSAGVLLPQRRPQNVTNNYYNSVNNTRTSAPRHLQQLPSNNGTQMIMQQLVTLTDLISRSLQHRDSSATVVDQVSVANTVPLPSTPVEDNIDDDAIDDLSLIHI